MTEYKFKQWSINFLRSTHLWLYKYDYVDKNGVKNLGFYKNAVAEIRQQKKQLLKFEKQLIETGTDYNDKKISALVAGFAQNIRNEVFLLEDEKEYSRFIGNAPGPKMWPENLMVEVVYILEINKRNKKGLNQIKEFFSTSGEFGKFLDSTFSKPYPITFPSLGDDLSESTYWANHVKDQFLNNIMKLNGLSGPRERTILLQQIVESHKSEYLTEQGF